MLVSRDFCVPLAGFPCTALAPCPSPLQLFPDVGQLQVAAAAVPAHTKHRSNGTAGLQGDKQAGRQEEAEWRHEERESVW